MIPGRVVKYYSAGDQHFYDQGSIQLGTLTKYANGEGHRFSDKGEGVLEVIHNSHGLFSGSFSAPGYSLIDVRDCSIVNCSTIVAFNYHTFCCTDGDYDKEQHIDMVNKNPTLTEYAIIDKARLIISIKAALSRSRYLGDNGSSIILTHGAVAYGDRRVQNEIKRFSNNHYRVEANNDVIKAAFIKPLDFEHEREFRIMVSTPNAKLAPNCLDPLNIQSVEIRRSIIKFGSI